MNEVINITPTEPQLSTSNIGDVGTIKLNNLPPLDTNTKKSVNFGPGIEMLMNDKRRSSSPKSDIKLSDLESLDTTINLNDSINTSTSNISRKDATATMFGTVPSKDGEAKGITLNVTEKINVPSVNATSAAPAGTTDAGPALGAATAQNKNNEKTWDGFKKFNEIPVDPTKQVPKTPQLSNDEILREKLRILRKLEALEKKGIQLTKKIQHG